MARPCNGRWPRETRECQAHGYDWPTTSGRDAMFKHTAERYLLTTAILFTTFTAMLAIAV